MKKILIAINRLGIGGAERVVVDDINEMISRGINVELITFQDEKEGNSLASECLISQGKWKKVYFKNLLSIHSWILLVRFIWECKPEVIMSHLWHANTVTRIASSICGVRIHLAFEHNVYDFVKTRKMFLVDRILQSLSTKIIAVSEAVKESLIRNGIGHNRISVLHNGVDTSRYLNIRDEKLRKVLNPKDEFIYIFIGRLITQKGVDVLLEAFAKLSSGLLLLAGDGIDKEKLLKLADRLGLQKRVNFLGIRQDIPNLLAMADCFILPSRYEGLPIVLIEAIVSGKAIIISDFEAGKELINNGENGLVVPRENPEALSHAMLRIQEDRSLRSALETKVKRDAEKFSIKHHIDALFDIITV